VSKRSVVISSGPRRGRRRGEKHEKPEPSWGRIYLAARKPFSGAIEALTSKRGAIQTAWLRELRTICPREGLESKFSFWNTVRRVSRLNFRDFRSHMERLGENFAHRGVPLERIVTAMDALLDVCLRHLVKERPELAIAVFRINRVAHYFFISSYSRHEEARLNVLQGQRQDAEYRLHGASAYVTNVYEQERRRLSHDLHDDIGHDLVMLKLYLEMLSTDLEKEDLGSLRPRLDDARALVSHTLDSVRRLVLDLGPAVFDDLGFLPAIKFYAQRFSATTGIEVTVDDRNLPGNLPLTHQTAIYRVLQGSLSNVLTHSGARRVKVVLAANKSSALAMSIEDDGVGFDVGGVMSELGFGLTAMRERVAVLGGRVQVQSWPAGPFGGRHGTRIEVDLPLPGVVRS